MSHILQTEINKRTITATDSLNTFTVAPYVPSVRQSLRYIIFALCFLKLDITHNTVIL
jgi:hypothetical protein